MTDKELLERINNIELREGKERTVKSYVLRNNVISPKSERIIKEHMNHYGFFFEDAPLDYAKLFGNNNPVVIEIGFGNGDTTAEVAIRRPEFNYIGIEVFLQGFVNLLGELGKRDIENVRIIRFNAVDVLNHMIPDGSVEGFHIFFPDPWQKKRHHKRRLVIYTWSQIGKSMQRKYWSSPRMKSFFTIHLAALRHQLHGALSLNSSRREWIASIL